MRAYNLKHTEPWSLEKKYKKCLRDITWFEKNYPNSETLLILKRHLQRIEYALYLEELRKESR